MSDETTPAVERAEDAMVPLMEYPIGADLIREVLSAALDVEEMAQFFNPVIAEPARSSVIAAWRAGGIEDPEQLMALEEARAIELASSFRKAILGSD